MRLRTTLLVGLCAACSPKTTPTIVIDDDVATAVVPDASTATDATADLTQDVAAPPTWADLAPMLQPVVDGNPLPSVAAIVFDDTSIVAAGAVGVRKYGDPTAVMLDDHYHLGSCTKAMTATLAARIVERGDIAWTTKTTDILGLETVDPALWNITLLELMSHTAGMPGSLAADWPALWTYLWDNQDDPRGARMEVARQLFAVPPAQPVGTYTYSNAGFMIAGAMLEAATDTEWEELMQTELFEPLDMAGCGFGPQASPDAVDQPWPHQLVGDAPTPPTAAWDNPRGLGPAGTVYCSIGDWARFGRLHLGDGGTYLTAQNMALLHQVRATESSYALGWLATDRPWADGTALTHSGSNTLNYAIVWLAPAKHLGVMVTTNIAYTNVFDVLDGLVATLIGEYF